MEALAYIHSAVAFEDSDPVPQMRVFDDLSNVTSAPLMINLLGAIAVSTILLSGGAAMAQSLSFGDTGPEVAAVQRSLGIPADGDFGPQTEQAVREFQRCNGLEVDGIVGPVTLDALARGSRGCMDSVSSGFVSSAGGGGSAFSIPSGYRGPAIVRTTSGLGVNVRNTPNGDIVAGIDDGTRVQLNGRQVASGGFTWAELVGGGWVATNFLVATNGVGIPDPEPIPRPLQGAPYVVAVPGDSPVLLQQVRRFAPGAFVDTSPRGSFIHAASFAQRSNAERVSRQLRNEGFNARVAYRYIF